MKCMEDCIFCKMIEGKIPCTKVYENESVLAFLDIHPVNKGHTLVIPKKHSKNIYETRDEILSEMILVAKKISTAIKASLKADGVNVIINNDTSGGQVIFHIHIHIIPRIENDGLAPWLRGKDYEGEEEKESFAKKIASVIE